jgi:hypothetical protein
MKDTSQRLANLSPDEKRALLSQLLNESADKLILFPSSIVKVAWRE